MKTSVIDQEERFILESPKSAQGILRQAKRKGQRGAAIKAMCLQCTGFDRKEVKSCVTRYCALWYHRPYQSRS